MHAAPTSMSCLVPLEGRLGPSWLTDQAVEVASTFGLTLHGLRTRKGSEGDRAQWAFEERCAARQVPCKVVFGIRRSQRHAAMTEVGFVMAAWAPSSGGPLAFLRSPVLSLVRHAVRPVWVARPGDQVPRHLTVAFHGQRKAFHAVAQTAALALAWQIPADILVVGNRRDVTDHDALIAREELLFRGVRDRRTFYEQGVAGERLARVTTPSSLLVMGGAGDGPVFGFGVSTVVRVVLKDARGPVLLCP